MRRKEILKKCMWIMLVILMTFLMIQAGRDTLDNLRIERNPTFQYYAALLWEIVKGIAAVLPVWLLSLLGLTRSFLGENWFPFAEKIPARVTKIVLALSAILLVGVTVAGAVYSEYTRDSFHIQYVTENRFDGWQTVFAWGLFYSILLYIEQWCIRKNCCRQDIRKMQLWVVIIIFISYLIVAFLDGVNLWYIPLSRVDCPNNLEDYYLWWFSLYCAVFLLPFLFFAARKTVRLFKKNGKWLALAPIIPRKITALIALTATGLMLRQIREWRHWREWTEMADIPEYGEAAALGHTFQAMMWGLLLFYMICLFMKQIRAARRTKCEQ